MNAPAGQHAASASTRGGDGGGHVRLEPVVDLDAGRGPPAGDHGAVQRPPGGEAVGEVAARARRALLEESLACDCADLDRCAAIACR